MTIETLVWCGYAVFLAACAGGLSWVSRPAGAPDGDEEFGSFAVMELRRGLARLVGVLSLAFVAVAASRAPALLDGIAVAICGMLVLGVAWLTWRRPAVREHRDR